MVSSSRKQASARPKWSGRLNNGLVWLVLVNGISYLTSLLRERFLYQHEYGTHALDDVVVFLAVTAIIGSALGVALAFWWSAGRLNPRALHLGAAAAVLVAGIVAIVSPVVSLLLVYLAASSGFMVATQRAAGVGRQFYALLAAVTAPGPTIAVWTAIGVRSTSNILLGYAVGATWQASGAWLAGRGSLVSRSPSSASLLWPMAYIAAVQLDGVADISVMLLAGKGWPSACAFAYNAFSGTAIIFIAPLGAQALAGRFNPERPGRLLLGAGGIAAVYVALVPFVLRFALHGGAVVGAGYHRVLILTLLYAPALPFAIFWQLLTRAGHRDADRWRSLAIQATSLFFVHLVLLAVVVGFRAWTLVPLSTCGSFAILSLAHLASRHRTAQGLLPRDPPLDGKSDAQQ
jgi:hypothetical protein